MDISVESKQEHQFFGGRFSLSIPYPRAKNGTEAFNHLEVFPRKSAIESVRYTLLVRSPWTCENPGKVESLSMKFLPEIELKKL